MTTQPTGTVTFLFTDIEGSTRLWDSDAAAMGRMVARHDEILNARIAEKDGYVFTTAGDAFAAAFTDPHDAVEAAISIQRDLGAESWERESIRIRIGLHTGVAQERDGDYFGPTLNRAARIMSAGHGGQVLVSQATRDVMSQDASSDLVDLGEHRLKDLGTPEKLFQIAHTDLESEFAPLKTLNAHLNNLPVELSSFIGRHDELTETTKRLRDSRLVTLTGVGGSGKTRLALQTAAESFDDFPDGVWVAEMAGLAEPERFPHWVAEEMGIARAAGGSVVGGASDNRPWIEVIVEYLVPRTALLVLDNCEHLIAPAAEFAETLLRSCPDLKIVTTSREGLGIRGEYLIQVPSLALPSFFDASAAETGYPDAMELFAERASAANARFELDSESAPAIADICRRLDGMPLAIELAAARCRMMTVDQIAERLNDSFRLLTGGSRTALPRQQTLLATVDWSYNLLTDQERTVFDRLAVFRAGFTLEAAEAIVSDDDIDEFDVLPILSSLVDKSMVQGGADSGRFRLLETLRQYALGKLTDAGEGDRWRRRHAEFFAAVGDEAYDATRDTRQVQWMNDLEADHDNLRAALTWAFEANEVALAARICAGVWFFWQVHQHWKQALEYLDRIDPDHEAIDQATATKVLIGRSFVRGFETQSDAGLPDSERATLLAREIGDARLVSHAVMTTALAHQHHDRYDQSLREFEDGYNTARSANDEWGMGWNSIFSAWGYRIRAEVDETDRWIAQARRHFAAGGSTLGMAWAGAVEGIMHRYRFDYEASIAAHRESLSLLQELGDRGAEAWTHTVIGISLGFLGRYEEAIATVERGHAIERDLGRIGVESSCVGAQWKRAAGDLKGALASMLEVRDRLDDSRESELVVYAEETADLGIEFGLHDAAARLVAWARGARIRVDRPIPGPFQEERAASDAAIREFVDDVDSIESDWSTRSVEDVVPILHETLDALEVSLSSP